MKCPNCGDENPDVAKFCEKCGKVLPTESGTETQTMDQKEEKTSKMGNKKLLIIGLVVIVIIIAAAALFIYAQPGNNPQNSTVFLISAVSGTATVTDPADNVSYPVTINYYGLSSGSGFLVTKDGYLITAGHVVGDPWDLQKKGVIRKMEDKDLKFYVDKAAVYTFLKEKYPSIASGLTEDQLDNITNTWINAGAVKANTYKHQIYVRGPAFPDSAQDPKVARIVDMVDSSSEKDIALLKVDNVNNLPALALNNQKIQTGDQVKIYGYPKEQFAFYSGMNIQTSDKDVWKSIYTATLTTGIVSGERTSGQGTRYYQTDAAVDSGSSGGPVCNQNNQAIGLVVIGFEKQGFNFFLPAEYITEICKKNGVSVGGSILPF